MYHTRQALRQATAKSYQLEEFCPGQPLILHWDGKLLPDIEHGKESVERIAVLVSGDGKEKLLGDFWNRHGDSASLLELGQGTWDGRASAGTLL